MTIDERISAELRRHVLTVDEAAAWERIEFRAPARRRARSIRLVAVPVAVVSLVVAGYVLTSTLTTGPGPVSPSDSPLLGSWVANDLDGSTSKMTIESSLEKVEMVVRDDFASVCSGAASTMTGTGRIEGNEVVFPSPILSCDDGSVPQTPSGISLEEQLQDLTFVHDPRSDTLTDSLGLVWAREASSPDPTISNGMWPQSSTEQIEQAQGLADAGDPDYTWQLGPIVAQDLESAQIFGRFLREQLGWRAFMVDPYWGGEYSEGEVGGVVFLRCAPGSSNPLYPDDLVAGDCAPTIDESSYETVEIDVAQPGRLGVSGIWVVTGWRTVESYQQMAPPTDDEVAALLQPFLQARIDGTGADGYVDETIPLLYGTATGERYETFDYERIEGPEWPDGGSTYLVRMMTADGGTVVEQEFRVDRDAPGRLDLEYTLDGGSTSENGQSVSELPQPHEFLDGEVTFKAVPSWDYSWAGWEFSPTMSTLYLAGNHEERLVLLADPRPIESACSAGAAPGDAAALGSSLRSDPDLQVTDPIAATIAGSTALQLDVTVAGSGNLCGEVGIPEVVAGGTSTGLEPGQRMRIYLIDRPGGSNPVFAILVVAPEDRFASVIEQAAPVIESLEFRTD